MTTRRSLLISVFNDQTQAEQAIERLQQAGINNDQIRYSAGGTHHGGFLAGMKSLFTGEKEGEESGQFSNDLTSMGLSSDEADYYAREHEAGRTIVTVQPGTYEQDAQTILNSCGGSTYGAGTNAAQAGSYQTTSGSSQPAGTTQQANDTQASRTRSTDNYATTGQDQSLKLREERLRVEKERVQSGEVRLHKDVVTEQKSINVPVTHEEVFVEHRPVTDQRVSDTPIGKDEAIRVPVSKEQVNVSKNTVETGEVHIGKHAVEGHQQVADTVQREEAHVERDGEPNIRTNVRPDNR